MDYTISIQPNADHIKVSVQILDCPDPRVTVAMPVWVPGYYRVLNQQSGVSDVQFRENGKALATEHPTDATWTTAHEPNAPLTVDYKVKRQEFGFSEGDSSTTLGQMGVHVDRNSAFIHPGIACVYVEGHKDARHTVKMDIPAGWEVAAPLRKTPKGVWEAPDYDTLNDSPIQAGKFRRIPFSVRGHGFEIIVTGKPRVSDEVMSLVCRKAAEGGIDFHEGWTPFRDYQFHFHFPPGRNYPGAGLEHRNSCVIVFGANTTDEQFLLRSSTLVNHEFFHAWNVKALRPEGLGPFDYQNAVPNPSLWLAEGVTDYYSYITGARAGLWSPESALARFVVLARDYLNSPGLNTTSLARSSLSVWNAADNSSSGSGGTNFYTKGLLAGWLLDIEIRSATKNKHSLDDAMRLMMRRFAVQNKPYPPDALLTAIKDATGCDVTTSYRKYIDGTEDLPFLKVVPLAGVKVETSEIPVLMLGASTERGSTIADIKAVTPSSAADIAGMQIGDRLLRIDDEPVVLGKKPLLGGKPRRVGDRVPVLLLRNGKEMTVEVVVQGEKTISLAVDPNAPDTAKTVWKGLWASDRYASR